MSDIEFPEKLEVLFQPAPYKILEGGRGAAKTWNRCRALLILGMQRKLRILCAREFQNSIQDSVHKTLCDQIELMGISSFYRPMKTAIHGANGTEFMFAGLRHNVESIKSMEGIDILDVEEAVDVSKDSWEKVLPTIRKDAPGGPFEKGSEIWVSFNPELETDETYQRFVVHPPTGAVVVHLTWRDNPWFPKILQQQMEDMRTRDPDAYQNIWEGHCRQWLDGAIFANEMRAATEEGRITNVPYRHGVPVSVFCDLGYADYTALWFVQKVGMNYHIIDFHQDQFKFWPHYLGVIQSRGYVYDSIWLPHDGDNKNIALVDASKTVEGQTKAVGYRVKEVPNISVADGLNAARTMFPALYFDQIKCADGLNSLRRYRYQISKEGQFSREPKHDDASHAADAFRYLAVGTRDGAKTVKVSIPRNSTPNNSSSWMT